LVGEDWRNLWTVVAVVTAGDAEVEGVVAAAVSAVGRRDQLGRDSQSFAAIFGCN
jgi:hypothetical protein